MPGWKSVEGLFQDLRYTTRQLGRNPGFAIVAVLSLALGIGANTAIFGLIDHVMLRFLPVRNPEELLVVRGLFSYPRFEQIRDRNEVFSGVFGSHTLTDMTVKTPGNPAGQATGELVSGTYFQMLGVNTVIGRPILPEDDRAPESSPVAVISYGFWKQTFGGSPDVLGKKLQVRTGSANANTGGLDIYEGPGSRNTEGAVLTIIGVAPPEFFGDAVGTSTDIWIPMMMQPAAMPGRPWLAQRGASWVNIMGRRKPGVSEEQARASMAVLWRRILTDEAGDKITEKRKREIAQANLRVESGEKGFGQIRRQFSQPLQVLMTVVGLVLLIACLNVANLLLARATARRREIGVRLSLGAGRARLIRQLLTESLVLASLGGALGLVVAGVATQVLLAMVAGSNEAINIPFQADLRTLGFAAGLAALTGILFGLAPALRATRISLADTLKDAARNSAGGRRGSTAKILVAGQVSVSLLLLIGAGLFLRTLYNLKHEDVGYDRENLLLMCMDPISAGYRRDDIGRVCQRVLDRVRNIPGVRAATFSENGLFSGTESGGGVDVEGFTPSSDDDRTCRFDQVGPGYFTNIGIPLLLGRDFNERDLPGAPRVTIINETMAKFYFHGSNPIGKHITSARFQMEIVGVVRDAQDHNFRWEPVRRFYVSYFQPIDGITTANFEIRTVGNPAGVISMLRNEVQAVDRNLPVLHVRTVKELMDQSVTQEKLVAKLSAVFGALAMMLAAIGLYGVMSYAVARRTNEIGIRMALGARSGNVARMILGEVSVLIVAGAVAGIGGAWASTRLVKSLLFGLTALDPLTFAGAAAVLALVGIVAGYIPARRASKIDPMVALRYE